MYIAPYQLIPRGQSTLALRAFLEPTDYYIQEHNRTHDLLVLHGPLDERKRFMLQLWLSGCQNQ
jgi:hypothetical protein